MFGEGGIGVTWITDLVDALKSLLGVVIEPPLVYFVILGLVGIVAKMVRKFVRIRKA